MSQKALAEEESSIWEALPRDERHSRSSVYWCLKDPSKKQVDVDRRRAIYIAKSDRLWDEVSKGMSIAVAADIAIAARAKHATVDEALDAVIAIATNTEDPCAMFTAAARYKDGDVAVPTSKRQAVLEDGWKQLKQDAEYLAMRVLSGEDPGQVALYITEFLVDVDASISTLRRKLRVKGNSTASRAELEAACLLLAVDPPRNGEPVDELYKKQAQKLRVANHPDRLGAAYDHERYNDIGRALQVLNDYNEKIQKGTQ